MKKIKNKKRLIILSSLVSLATLVPASLVVAACTNKGSTPGATPGTSSSNTDAKSIKENDIQVFLNSVLKSANSLDFYQQKAREFNELKNNSSTTLEGLNVFYTNLVDEYHQLVKKEFSELSGRPQTDSQGTSPSDGSVLSELTKRLTDKENELAGINLENEYNNLLLLGHLEGALERAPTGDKTLLWVIKFFTYWLEDAKKKINEDPNYESKGDDIRLIDQIISSGEEQQLSLFLGEEKQTALNVSHFKTQILFWLNRYRLTVDSYFKTKLSITQYQPNVEFMNLLFDWRINDLKKVLAAINAKQATEYGEGETGQTVKNELVAYVQQSIKEFENAKKEAKSFQNQIILFATLNDEIFSKNLESLTEDDKYNARLKLNDLKISPFPLSGIIQDQDAIASLQPKSTELVNKYVEFFKGIGSELYSLYYKTLTDEFYNVLFDVRNFRSLEAKTQSDIILKFQEYEGLLTTKFTLTREKTEEDRQKINTQVDATKTRVEAILSDLVTKKGTDSENKNKYYDLETKLRAEYNKVNALAQSNVLQSFDKLIAYKMLEEKAKKLVEAFEYWTLIGEDPQSEELETLLGYKKDKGRFESQIQEAKERKQRYETTVKDKLLAWKEAIPQNYDQDADSLEQIKAYVNQHLAKLEETSNEIESLNNNDDWFNFDDSIKEKLNSFNNTFKEQLPILKNEQTTDDVYKTAFNSLKEAISQAKDKIQSVIDDEIQQYINDEESSIQRFEQRAAKSQEISYFVPGQELIAFIRQWSINDMSEWSKIVVDKNSRDTEAYNYSTKPVEDINKTQLSRDITGINVDHIESTSEDESSLNKLTFRDELLAKEKEYYEASKLLLKAIENKQNDTTALKNDLKQKRAAYYAVLNDPKVRYVRSSFIKYNSSLYKSADQADDGVGFQPYDLANLYATFKASESVLQWLKENKYN